MLDSPEDVCAGQPPLWLIASAVEPHGFYTSK